MSSAEITNKPMRALVPVLDRNGSVTHYEWREVDGVEIAFTDTTLQNGETLTIEHSHSVFQFPKRTPNDG